MTDLTQSVKAQSGREAEPAADPATGPETGP